MRNLDIIQPECTVMKLSGMWPNENPTIFYKFRQFFSLISSAILNLTMLIQIYYTIDDFKELSEILYMASTITAFVIKLYLFRYQFKTVQQLLDDIEFLDSAVGDFHQSLQNAFKLSRFTTIFYEIIALCAAISHCIFPLFENKPLIFPFPFFNDGLFRLPLYALQGISLIFVAWNNTGFDITVVGFMLVIGAQFDVLKNQLEFYINSGCTNEEQLKKCCIYHNNIINLAEQIERLFVIGLLAQFASSAICICNTGFYFMLITWKSFQFMALIFYFSAMFTQLFIYCWFGNEMMLKSIEVGDACYNSEWYTLDTKLIKYVFLIMERCKRPTIITIYNIGTLSLISYVSILNWSYSYYALLRRLYKNGPN